MKNSCKFKADYNDLRTTNIKILLFYFYYQINDQENYLGLLYLPRDKISVVNCYKKDIANY